MFGRSKKKFTSQKVDKFIIRELDKKDWQQFRKLYLEAIKNYPTLIVDTYSERKSEDDSYWERWIADSASDSRSLIVGIFHKPSREMVGFCIVNGRPETKLSHVADLVPLFLLEPYHNENLESEVLKSVFLYLDQFTGIHKLQTFITLGDKKHLIMYNTLGFVRYGLDQNHFKVRNRFYDSVLLSKQL